MIRTDVRELDQLVRQYLRAGWHPALAAHESAATFIQRKHAERAPHRLRILRTSGAIAINRSAQA